MEIFCILYLIFVRGYSCYVEACLDQFGKRGTQAYADFKDSAWTSWQVGEKQVGGALLSPSYVLVVLFEQSVVQVFEITIIPMEDM